jgi:glycosyltransferase involved in cell wall biosynthesis
MNQTIRDSIQVIVVDDGSTQSTASVVSDFQVDFIPLDTNHGLSYARNAGIARARSAIVAFTDDDVVVPSDWCERLLEAWQEAPPDTRAIGGEVVVADATSMTQRYLTRHNPLSPIELDIAPDATFLQRLRIYLKRESESTQSVRHVHSLVGANMSFNLEALSRVGGFDSSIRFGGDEEHVCRILRKQFGDQSILCYSSIVVAHNFDPRLRDTLRRAFLYGVSNGRTWARDGGLPSVRPVGGLFVASLIFTAPLSLLGASLISLLIPFIMWRRWVSASWRERNPEAIIYPLIALAQELCANMGFLVGWRKERRRSTSPSLQ